MTKWYLKENNLLAVPFDKGIGICVMKKDAYHTKLNAILQLSQFEKVTERSKNALNPVLKEENRVVKILKDMMKSGQIDEKLFKKLRPSGSQPPRF